LYAHLSSFNRNTKVGRNVKQGQVIGYVGSTGLATGPHLHYEFHVDGVQRDPLRVDFPKAETIPASLQDDFKQHTQSLLTWLDSFNASVASGPSEAY
jgi:murein DD-endopeptidase MepM/ murein hydrolase activator NlpD